MPNWVYLLPDDGIIFLLVATVVGATIIALLICRYALGVRVPPEEGDTVWDAYAVVVSLTALVLAFALFQAQANLRNVEAGLHREANTLVEVDREVQRLAAATDLRARLAGYGRAILADEWPSLAGGGRGRRVDDVLGGLMREASAIEPTGLQATSWRDELLRKLERLSELREERITSATLRLPRAFWHTIAALVLITVLIAGATPWTVRRLSSVLLAAAALAVLVALVAIVDVPFQGESAVRPVELQRAVDAISRQG